jgi:ribosome-binding protein aMBF1 (putative translation factor)
MLQMGLRRCDRCRSRRCVYAENGLCLACTRFASHRSASKRIAFRGADAANPKDDTDTPQPAIGVGSVFRRYRRLHGLTQQELGKLLNFDQSYVSRLESGRRKITDLDEVRAIARKLDLPLREFGLIDSPSDGHRNMHFDPRFALTIIRLARTSVSCC